MARKHIQNQRVRLSRPARHMTSIELRAITFISTLILAGIAIIMQVNEPVVWGFLGTAIGMAIGQAVQSNNNR